MEGSELEKLVLIPSGSKICLVGKTNSGKSTLLKEMLEQSDDIFSETPSIIYFVYQYEQDFFIPLRQVLAAKGIHILFIHRNVPTAIENPQRKHLVLAVDDLDEQRDIPTVANYFLRAARHNKITIIINFQSLFVNNDHFRAIMSNADFIALFYMTKVASQLKCFAYQLFGDKKVSDAVIRLYHKLTNEPSGSLILDLRQGVSHRIRNTFSLCTAKRVEFYRITTTDGGGSGSNC